VFGRYNDSEATRAEIRAHAPDLACVLIEPMIGSGGCIPADPAFLAMLRDETRAAGALLIFDEVMTSRFGRGGAQGLYGITPDMTTLGKWVGGGMSFGAFGGSAALMDLYDPSKPDHLPHAGTFNNNVLTMSAGVAAMADVFTADAAAALHARGDHLREAINSALAAADVNLQATGLGSMIHLHPTSAPLKSPADLAGLDERLRDLVFFDLVERGYYIGRRGFIALTLALTDRQLDGFVEAISDMATARRGVLGARSDGRTG
jgi:glutamate-1-semialdehyde 2,1-aminomutase